MKFCGGEVMLETFPKFASSLPIELLGKLTLAGDKHR